LYREPARKAYSFYGSDPEIRFKERRLSIRIYMPTLSAYEVQKRIENLNDELTVLKEEIEECQKAIQQLRVGKDPENARREFRITWSLNVGSREIIDSFKAEIASRKHVAGWIRRERAIYLWELRLRKVEGLKLPLTRHKIGTLQTEAKDIVVDLKGHMEQVNQLLERYRQVFCETGELERKVRKLSLENQPSTILLPKVPSYMQETTQKQLKELNETCAGLN
jgi:DnaJ-domain-containing protein 1